MRLVPKLGGVSDKSRSMMNHVPSIYTKINIKYITDNVHLSCLAYIRLYR